MIVMIQTQDGNLVNLNNIVQIYVAEGEMLSEDGKGAAAEAFALAGTDVNGEQVGFAYFSSISFASGALNDLTRWLCEMTRKEARGIWVYSVGRYSPEEEED